MSRILPSLPRHDTGFSAGELAEIALLRQLQQALPGGYTLFHNVDWSRGSGPDEQHGELDIVVVNRGGDALLLEVKAGDVEMRANGIFKQYANGTKDVTRQCDLQYGALRGRLSDAGLPVRLHHLLVLPGYRVLSETAQWPRARIVDSTEVEQLGARIEHQLGPGIEDAALRERVLAFFENRFRVAPDVSALARRVADAATRMAAGLATWVPRIESASGLVRVLGTAGSGKTQLALRLLKDADARGQRAAYLCFNRALADHIARLVPVRVTASTFHEYALAQVRRADGPVDVLQTGAYERIARRCLELVQQADPDLDLIVLDELQDLQPDWVHALLLRLRAEGRGVLLEDPEQQLYRDREAFDLPDAVRVYSHENFRTPRALVKLINGLRLTDTEVEAMSPHAGELPEPIVYASADALARCTQQAVQRCLDRGHALADIAVISLRGRERSALLGLDQLGPWRVTRYTGQFDANEAPIWTEGELLVESVRRFKGQAAPAVVLTECDLDTLDAISRRLLFVGLTRARLHLEWVISGATEALVARTLQ